MLTESDLQLKSLTDARISSTISCVQKFCWTGCSSEPLCTVAVGCGEPLDDCIWAFMQSIIIIIME